MSISKETTLLFTIRFGIFMVLLVPLVVTQDTLFPYIVGKAIYVRSLIEIIFACWLILVMYNSSYKPARSWIIPIFGTYVLISLLAALFGISFQRSFWGDFRRMGGVFDLAHWFAFVIVLVSVLKNVDQWRLLLNANLWICLLISILGLAQHYNVRIFDWAFWYLEPTGRVDITFGNPSYVAAYMLINLFIALAFLAHSYRGLPQPSYPQTLRKRRRRPQPQHLPASLLPWRLFWATTVILSLWVLMLTGTRGGIVALVVGLFSAGVGYQVWGSRKGLRVLVGGLMAMLLLAVLIAPLARNTAIFQKLVESNVTIKRYDRLITSGFDDPSIIARLDTATTGLKTFIDAPIFGWGPENFAPAHDRFVGSSSDTPMSDQAHNKPIEELATKGILGLASYLLLFGWIAWVLIRSLLREPEERMFTLFIGTALIAYVVQNLVLFDTHATFLQFIILLGWVAGREAMLDGGPIPSETLKGTVDSRDPLGTADDRGTQRNFLREALGKGGIGDRILPRQWLAMGSIVLLLVTSLITFNLRPFRAAQLFPLESTNLGEFFTDLRESFDAFPPLATFGRQVLLDTVYKHWGTVSKGAEATLLLDLQVEAQAALKSEPKNPRLYLGLAHVYRSASVSDPGYLPLAREYLDQAHVLAPNLFETLDATIHQEIAEEDYAGALILINSYSGSDPNRIFETLEAAILQKIAEEDYANALILINSYSGSHKTWRIKTLADEVIIRIITQERARLFETLDAAILQKLAEEDYAGALILLNSYSGSDRTWGIKTLADAVQTRIILQIGEMEYACRWADQPPDLTPEERAQIPCE